MRGFRLTGLLLCVFLGCSSAKPFAKTVSPQKPADQDMQFEMARGNEKEGHLAKAEASYRELCEAKPDVARYHQRWGVVLTRLGRRDEGVTELERARQMDPKNTNILNDLGYAHLQSGESAKAVTLFKKTLEIDSQNKRANNNLALALGYEGDLKESFRTFQNTMPEAEALTNLGYVATQNGNTGLAVKAYSRALTLEPDKKSAAEALTQLALLDQDIEQSRGIANDLNTANDLRNELRNGHSSDALAEYPLKRASASKQAKSPVSSNPPKVSVSHSAPRKKSVSATTDTSTSAKVLLSNHEE